MSGAIQPGPRIDLDALRAMRAEQRQTDGPVLHVGGVDYPLPIELPLPILFGFGRLASGDLSTAEATVTGLLGPGAAEVIDELTAEDLEDVISRLGDFYGLGTPGNSPASPS